MDDLIPEIHSEEVLNPRLEKDLIIFTKIYQNLLTPQISIKSLSLAKRLFLPIKM
mgnify:CR=1 FL=1